MATRIEANATAVSTIPPATRHRAYAVLAAVATLTSAGIWLLMIVDEGRSVGAATLEMVAKFTNLTVVLVGVVAAWIAFGWSPGSIRETAHLTVMVMAVVTAAVNATLLDPALPAGWWGVVDFFQHYAIPVAVVATWAVLGPRVDARPPRIARILAIPLAWLVFVLARGALTEKYPYDFIDVAQNGWVSVVATVAALVVVMLAAAFGFAAIDSRRSP